MKDQEELQNLSSSSQTQRRHLDIPHYWPAD